MTCNRIFTITCRGGKALLFSNRVNEQGKRPYQKFTGTDSRCAALKAWIKVLEIMPDDNTEEVAILLPKCVSFLSFENTRSFWLENECTKSGEVIDEETLELVTKLDELLANKGLYTHNISHSYAKAYKYKTEINLAWGFTNKIFPVEFTADNMEEIF